ncbi:MAG: DinB family protein, partial [Bacteroidota bacterium]
MPTSAKLPFAIRQRLKIQHTAVEDMVAPLSAPDLQERVIPTKWSIHTHLAHLGRYQVVFESRLDRILTEEKPTLDRYIAENDPLFIKWKEASWEENWKQLKRDRRHLITRLFALTAEGH